MSEHEDLYLLFINVNFFTYINAYKINLSIIHFGFTNYENPPVIENADWLTTLNNRHIHHSIIHFIRHIYNIFQLYITTKNYNRSCFEKS